MLKQAAWDADGDATKAPISDLRRVGYYFTNRQILQEDTGRNRDRDTTGVVQIYAKGRKRLNNRIRILTEMRTKEL